MKDGPRSPPPVYSEGFGTFDRPQSQASLRTSANDQLPLLKPTVPEPGCGPCKRSSFWAALFILSVIASAGVIIYAGVHLYYQDSAEKHVVAWFIGGCFVALTVPVSVFQIVEHLRNYCHPTQKYVVRILWMVPIYSVDGEWAHGGILCLFNNMLRNCEPIGELGDDLLAALLSLRFKEAGVYFDALRECYEAYVIYNFVTYLIVFLGDEESITDTLELKEDKLQHLFPFCCLRQWRGQDFLRRCHFGSLQYVLVRVVMTVVVVILRAVGKYENGLFAPDSGYMYVTFITNASQMWALYCLILFYTAMQKELAPMNPIGKFVSVKLIVFFSFWQGVVIAIFVYFGVIKPTLGYTTYDISEGLQNLCICIEMLLAAVAHRFVFPVNDFISKGGKKLPFMDAFASTVKPSDVVREVHKAAREAAGTLSGNRTELTGFHESR